MEEAIMGEDTPPWDLYKSDADKAPWDLYRDNHTVTDEDTTPVYGGKYAIKIPKEESNYAEKIANTVMAPIEYVDRFTGAPTRSFFSAIGNGAPVTTAISNAYNQFGEPSNPYESGKNQELRAMAEKGEKDASISDVFPSIYSGGPQSNNPFLPEKGGKFDISKSGAWGLARDIVQN